MHCDTQPLPSLKENTALAFEPTSEPRTTAVRPRADRFSQLVLHPSSTQPWTLTHGPLPAHLSGELQFLCVALGPDNGLD